MVTVNFFSFWLKDILEYCARFYDQFFYAKNMAVSLYTGNFLKRFKIMSFWWPVALYTINFFSGEVKIHGICSDCNLPSGFSHHFEIAFLKKEWRLFICYKIYSGWCPVLQYLTMVSLLVLLRSWGQIRYMVFSPFLG